MSSNNAPFELNVVFKFPTGWTYSNDDGTPADFAPPHFPPGRGPDPMFTLPPVYTIIIEPPQMDGFDKPATEAYLKERAFHVSTISAALALANAHFAEALLKLKR
jgi:hypothetical protein